MAHVAARLGPQPPGRQVIAVDFDGVLHDHLHPVEGRTMGPPIDGAVAGMRRLAARHEVVIFTARGGSPQHVIDWLRFYGVPFSRVTNVKEAFDSMLDDHAVKFTGWSDVNL